MIRHIDYPEILFFEKLKRYDNISHFSSTRNGGISSGEFKSLNLGNYSDDDPLNIYENRNILSRKFHVDSDKLITPHQTHSNKVIKIDKEFISQSKSSQTESLYGYDASITNELGLFLCVTTADCVPILLFDPVNNAIGAVHAGWKGTSKKIIERTINYMNLSFKTSTNEIIACIGPSISVDHYEVGKDVEEEFNKNGFVINQDNSYFNESTGKTHIDLKEMNYQELLRLGVKQENIEKTNLCTYKSNDLFFSARRQTIRSGRMMTGIMLHRK